jgi:hypothetical protein
MKKILSLVLISLGFISVTIAQSNKIGSGTNFYETANLIGQSLPALSATPAGNALVFVDYSHSDDGVVSALHNKNFIVTVATDWNDFSAKLSSGNFHLAVGFAQNYPATTYGLSLLAIQHFIENGGSMIFATWSDADASIATYFDAAFTGTNNLTTVTITDPIVANGLTNPFTLANPSWGIYSKGMSTLAGGEVLATFENGNAAMIRGNNGHTVILGYLSDTPSVVGNRDEIFTNIALAANVTVPIPYVWIIGAFFLIACGVVFSKRKVIFS